LDPDDGSLSLPAFDKAEATVSPDGRQLLLGIVDDSPHIQLMDLASLKVADNRIPSAGKVFPRILTFDRTGKQWAVTELVLMNPSTSDQKGPITPTAGLWRREGEQIRFFALSHQGFIRGAFFREDGVQILTAGDDRVTRIWNTTDGSPLQEIRCPRTDLAWVDVSPDLRTAIVLLRDGKGRRMVLREVQTGKTLGPDPEQNPDINAAKFSPDGTRVGAVGDNQCGRIWDARSGQPITSFFKHGGALKTIAWSPDGRRVLTAGLSPEVKVWDAATGDLALPPLLMKAKPVECASFSANGRFIVAASEEKLVRARRSRLCCRTATTSQQHS